MPSWGAAYKKVIPKAHIDQNQALQDYTEQALINVAM